MTYEALRDQIAGLLADAGIRHANGYPTDWKEVADEVMKAMAPRVQGSHEALREALKAGPTPGPWDIDSTANDGEYGNNGPDTRSGFLSSVVMNAEGRAICDTLNSDVAEVEEWCDEDDGGAIDVRGQKNATYIAAANPETIAALLADIDRLTAERDALAKDAERLDWLESFRNEHAHGMVRVFLSPCGGDMCFTQIRGWLTNDAVENFPTVKGGIREAIDAAIAAMREGK